MRNSMIWRNLLLLTEGNTGFPYFNIPPIFFDPDLPRDWRQEFVRGYADVAGNIRHANRYRDGRHRVRLDILNYPTNWKIPVQLCTLLQEHLEIPVQLITWGHPNLGRDFREHQLNIFAKPFLPIGFSFEHKQKILEEFVQWDDEHFPTSEYRCCPGFRRSRQKKPSDARENDSTHLDTSLVGVHFDSYWQICKQLGCNRGTYADTLSFDLALDDETDEDTDMK